MQTVWAAAFSLGIVVAETRNQPFDRAYIQDGSRLLTDPEKNLIMEVVWSLIIQGILVPALDDNNQGWPYLRLTEYGKRCVDEDRVLPHDPDGFLIDFHREVQKPDPIVVDYLTEALQCYIHGLHRSAAVMLGGASEQAILLLIDSYANSIGDPNARRTFTAQAQKSQSIFRKFQLFDKQLSGLRQRIPQSLTDNLDSLLRGVFDLIRNSRNDAGHPAVGSSVSRDAIYSHLRLFTPYYKRISDLIAWFNSCT